MSCISENNPVYYHISIPEPRDHGLELVVLGILVISVLVIVKPSAKKCVILRHVEEPFKKGKIFCRLNSSFYFSSSFCFATAFRFAREL
jgi:hypothetical protein